MSNNPIIEMEAPESVKTSHSTNPTQTNKIIRNSRNSI